MKKFLSILLLLVLTLSLCGCGAATQAQLDDILANLQAAQEILDAYTAAEEAGPAVDIPEEEGFVWNGQTCAWFLLPADVSPDMLLYSDAVASMCQANGWTYERKELGHENGTVLSLLRDALESDEVGAIIYVSLADALTDLVQQAADEGILILCLDPETTAPVAGSLRVPYAQMGVQAVSILTQWCEEVDYLPEEEDSELPVAVNLYGETDPNAPWPTALLAALKDSELLYNCRLGMVYEGGGIFNAAWLWAQEVMADLPDTRLFCCYTPEAAYGVCYYLEQYAADQELDLSDFCVVWCGEDAESQTYLSVAREDSSYTAARGYTSWGNEAWTAGSRIGYELLGIVYGTELPAGLEETYSLLTEYNVKPPEEFGGWLWGESGVSDVLIYTSFSESDDNFQARVSTPMTDIVNLIPEPEEAE